MQTTKPFKAKLRLKQRDANGRLRTVWGSHIEQVFATYAEMKSLADTMLRGATHGAQVHDQYGAIIATKDA